MSNRVGIKERIEFAVDLNSSLLERSGYSAESYCRVVLNAMVATPAIAECEDESLKQALLAAMNAGLVPDGKEAAIVPFKGRAQLIIMIEGRLKLAQQATKGLVVRSVAVYAGDEWDYAEGLSPRLDHVPNPGASNAPADLVAVYATAQLPGATAPQYDVMSRATVDRYRAYSAAPTRGPWASHFEEMAKNAVLKRLLKRLPKSSHAPVEAPELERVDTLEDATALGDASVDTTTGEITETPAAPKPSKPKPSRKPPPAAAAVAASAPGEPPWPGDDEAPF